MKVINIEPTSMGKAKTILERREKEGELNYEQKLALEHLKKFTKLDEKQAEKFIKDMSNIVKMAPDTLMQIANIMPKNADELRMIFAREKFSLKDDEISKILETVAKYK